MTTDGIPERTQLGIPDQKAGRLFPAASGKENGQAKKSTGAQSWSEASAGEVRKSTREGSGGARSL